MCGIAGLYPFEARVERRALQKIAQNMAEALVHRGPDTGDLWQDPEIPMVLVHRRLSILDLSPLGAQPMESQSGRYIIVFNGEIYNYRELRTQLEKGHSITFRGHSDTEVILALIDHFGFAEALEKINGMFAIALWDRREKALFLARDRFGKKPLYVGWAGSTLVFGSELKALCAHPEFRRDVNRNALTSFMRFGYVPAPLCIYQQVWHLPAGCMIALDMRMLRGGQDLGPLIETYWRHKDALEAARAHPMLGEEGDIIKDFDELLSLCVRDRMVADVPLGAFLSGGIDSSTIVALMQKNSQTPVKTYTIGFDETGYDEAAYAKAVAAHLGTDHHEMYLSGQAALDIVPRMPEIYDEPFADISAIPTYLVSKFARDSVTVALSGDGGDEMLGGYNRHISGPKSWAIVQNIPPLLRKPFSELISNVPTGMWQSLRPEHPEFGSHMHKFADILTKQTPNDVYLRLVSQWQNPKSIVFDGKEELIPLVTPDLQVSDIRFAEEMMYWDALSYLNGDILTKVDRASMAVSLEARAPLLDRRIYEYVWRLPLDYKIRNGKGKWLLRQVLQKYLPEELYERPKQGFSIPISQWLRHDLKDWAEDLLDEYELKAQGFLNYVEIRTLWQDHLKGRGNHAGKLWCVLMYQDWYRRWG